MYGYILLGAVVGAVIGHIIPPGYCFWFGIGAISGYYIRCYSNR